MPLCVALGHLSSRQLTGHEFQVWFGRQMRAAREAQGLNLPALAHMWPTPIDPGQIGAWERGDVYPRADKIAIYLQVLETTPEQVFCDSPS